MAAESRPLPTGAPAPDFTLPDTRSNQPVTLADHAGKPVLIAFMCNHCPYVIHVVDAFATLANSLLNRGLHTIAISSNDISTHPQDGPVQMAELASEKGFQFPYCFDENQSVARAFDAVCTPEFYLFDSAHTLFYHGQFDETRPGQGVAHGAALRDAIDALQSGQPAPEIQKPSVGCSIKWKAGQA